MPPIKGRLVAPPGGIPHTAGFRSVKQMMGSGGKRPSAAGSRVGKGDVGKDAALLRLRIPTRICAGLPSVRRFNGAGNYVDLTASDGTKFDTKSDMKSASVVRRRKSEFDKYLLKPIREFTFDGLIFDVALSPRGDIAVVSCESGAFMMAIGAASEDQSDMIRLENVSLGGGVGFLSDGCIAVVCRNRDTVSVYMPRGTFLRAFPAGECPLSLVVTPADDIVVADVGTEKCLRVYRPDGKLQRVIRSADSDAVTLRWPQYLANYNGEILVIDTHQQQALTFNTQGKFKRTIPLTTFGATTLHDPAGICVGGADDDLFVVDRSLGTLELFSSASARFLQTLTSPGGMPKVCDAVKDLMLIGDNINSVWLCAIDTIDNVLKTDRKPHVKSEQQGQTTDSIRVNAEQCVKVEHGTSNPCGNTLNDEIVCTRIKSEPCMDVLKPQVFVID